MTAQSYIYCRAKTGTEFWNRLSDLWKPNRNRLIVILSLIVGRSKLVQRTSEDDLSLPLMGWDPTISSVWWETYLLTANWASDNTRKKNIFN